MVIDKSVSASYKVGGKRPIDEALLSTTPDLIVSHLLENIQVNS